MKRVHGDTVVRGPMQNRWLECWNRADERNRRLGWARFDWGDLDSHSWILSGRPGVKTRLLRYALRGADFLAPLLIHRLVRMPSQVIPTAYYHVGLSYLLREQLTGAPRDWSSQAVIDVCSGALMHRIESKEACWEHPYMHHAGNWKVLTGDDRPPSCAHHTARVGEMLLKAGKRHDRQDFIEAGISAAGAMMTYHNWNTYDDGTCTVSYYPFTEDETINTAADTAALFAEIPVDRRDPGVQARLDGIVRTVVKEQQPDGSWFYCTERHYAKTGDTKFVDNHHSAQVLQALGKIRIQGALPEPLRKTAAQSIERGLRYYLDHFYDERGRGYYFPDSPRRSTPIVGYSEGIAAIYWAFKSNSLTDPSLVRKASSLIPKMAESALALMNRATGDVACTRFLGRNYHIQSLRWGSGPLMEALMYALLLHEELEGETYSPPIAETTNA